MIADGKLVRVDGDAGGVATSSGIPMGDSEARARQLYGSGMKVSPQIRRHKPPPDGSFD